MAVHAVRMGAPARRVASADSLTLLDYGLLAITFLLFTLSGGVLWTLGINYEGLTGGAASKLHPATYLTVALVAFAALRVGNPVAYVIEAMRARPAAAFLIVAGLVQTVQILVKGGAGLAGSIDSFVAPALLVLAVLGVREAGWRRVEILIHVIMLANALLAIGEFVGGKLLFPYRFDGQAFEWDTRSSALQGHPLTNATVGALYTLALLGGGTAAIPKILRVPAILIQLAALVTFGGRSAIVVTGLFAAIWLIRRAFGVLRSGRVPLLGAAGTFVALTAAPVVVAVLYAKGFFDTLLGRFQSDGGSANARVEMLDLFDHLPLRDLIFGPDIAHVDSMRRISGLEWGIENPIIKTVLYQGAIVTVLLTLAIALFMAEIVRRARPGVFMPILAFVLLINTSESIAGKTTMMSKFALVIIALFRPLPAAPGIRRQR